MAARMILSKATFSNKKTWMTSQTKRPSSNIPAIQELPFQTCLSCSSNPASFLGCAEARAAVRDPDIT